MGEAFCLLDKPFRDKVSLKEAYEMAKEHTALGAKAAVITGIMSDDKKLGIVKYDRVKDEYFSHFADNVETGFDLHGSGDVFASITVGCIASGMDTDRALERAVDLTAEAIANSAKNEDRRWYGIDFESIIKKISV